MRLRIRDSDLPVGDEVLSGLEKRLGLTLPDEYREFLRMHNGGVPRPDWLRLRVGDGGTTAVGFGGSLRWFGQKYGNESMRERWRGWHRVTRLFGVAEGGGGVSERPDFEWGYRNRPAGLPAQLAPVATVQGFEWDGFLCLDVSPDGPRRGRVSYWPDAGSVSKGIEALPVASSFDALLDLLKYPGETPPEWLMLVRDGDLDGLRHWVDRNRARLREKDEWGWTSVDHAAFEGRWEIVDFLLEKRDATPGMIFYDALVDGRFSTARGMLRYGIAADLVVKSLARKAEVFWTDPEMVREFLDAGADPAYIDDVASDGNAPLHYAAQAGAVDAVRLLLARGADPTAENEAGERPRDLATKRGLSQIVEVLDEAEAARPRGPAFEDEAEVFDLHAVAVKDSPGGLGEGEMAAFEVRLGVRLPGEYRGFLKRFNGGAPRPARFRLRDDDGAGIKCEVRRFVTVGGDTSFGDETDLEAARSRLADWGLPKRMLPIASVEDEFEGGTLCISLRGSDRGQIAYYVPTDGGDSTTYPVATSLSRLFERLSRQKDTTPAWVRAIEDDAPEALGAWVAGGGTLKKRYRGRSPLEIAVDGGRLQVVRWFLVQGAKADVAFRLALEAGQPGVLLELLKREGFRPDVPAATLSRLFFAPAVWRGLELMERLIDLGADVNAASRGPTPLMIAAQHATPEIVRVLLARGARANVWSEQGELALHRAVHSTSRPEMIEKMRLLIGAGESLHARAPYSALPPHVVETARALETPIVDLLGQGGPQASALRHLLEQFAGTPESLTPSAPNVPAGRTYFGQFQRTAAELLIEDHNDAEAVVELETDALPGQPGAC